MIKNRSSHNFNTNVISTDNILTLSTCYNNNEKMVIHAKLIKETNKKLVENKMENDNLKKELDNMLKNLIIIYKQNKNYQSEGEWRCCCHIKHP